MSRKNIYAPVKKCEQSVIFARVSSREQEQGASIDAQLKAIRYYSEGKGYINIKEYKITESSTNGERKRFYEMLDFVGKQKKKTAIIVYCIDRMQRGYKECVAIEQLLYEDKIEVHFYKEGFYLHKESESTDMNRYDMGVLSAKMYIGSMRDNVNRSLRYNWSIGKWQGYAPLGYINKEDANMELDPERAPIIKMLFEEYATTNHSLESLADLAKEYGLKSRDRKKKKSSDCFVSRNGIYHILKNPFYYGDMRVKGQLLPHIYEPIISKSLFDKVQKRLTGDKDTLNRVTYSSIPYIFRKIVRCSKCGCQITPETKTKKSGKSYNYLKCTHRKGPCNQKVVNESILLEQINDEIFKSFKISPTILDLIKKNVRQHLDNESIVNANVKRKITNQVNTLIAKEERLLDFFLDGNIDKSVYEAKKSEIEAEKAELQRTSEKYASLGVELKDTVECIMDIAANAPLLMKVGTTRQKNELLKLLFEDCVLDGKKLIYTLRKPFEQFIKNPKSLDWLSMNPEDLKDFDVLSGDVKEFRVSMNKS